jgi:hypothetical protein
MSAYGIRELALFASFEKISNPIRSTFIEGHHEVAVTEFQKRSRALKWDL